MRMLLPRFTALAVIGLALGTVPTVAVVRASGREATRVTARGGSHRLDASETVLHGHDDTPDSADAGDFVLDTTSLRDGGSPPGLPVSNPVVQNPPAGSRLLDSPPTAPLHSTNTFLRPLGRAPPVN